MFFSLNASLEDQLTPWAGHDFRGVFILVYDLVFSFESLVMWFHRNTGSLVQFSHSVVSDSLQPHEPQHTRPPCPSPAPRVYPNPCPLSRWCHPTISSSVFPFSSVPQSFPAPESFQWVSSLHQVAKVLEIQPQHQSFHQDWSLGWTGWISLQTNRLSRVFSNTTV